MTDTAGIGLLPSRIDPREEYGHMWVYWTTNEPSDRVPYRGYWPDLGTLPEGISIDDIEGALEFIRHNSVQGLLAIDMLAHDLHTSAGNGSCYEGFWSPTPEEKFLLDLKCSIPLGVEKIARGRYSWDESRPDWNNCSSWVIKIINRVVRDSSFLRCRHPKRLKMVIEDIWGKTRPPVSRGLR